MRFTAEDTASCSRLAAAAVARAAMVEAAALAHSFKLIPRVFVAAFTAAAAAASADPSRTAFAVNREVTAARWGGCRSIHMSTSGFGGAWLRLYFHRR